MEDITIFLLVGAVCIVIIEYYARSPPVYLLGELFGVGSLYQVIGEVTNGTMDNNIGLIFSIASIMAIIYGAMSLVNFYSKSKR